MPSNLCFLTILLPLLKKKKKSIFSFEPHNKICLISSVLGKSGEIYFPNLTNKDLVSFDLIIKDFKEQK